MFLAIDIGGTKTLLALFCPRGICLKRLKFKTDPSPETFVKTLQDNLLTFLPSAFRNRIKAITVAIPGVVKKESNSYSFSFGNLDWPQIDLFTPIKNLFSAQIFFVNDADLATLYEASRLSRQSKKSIYLTFSTGIGGGIFENGALSKSSASFEPGHDKYVYKGKTLEWEDIASAKALNAAYNSDMNSLVLDQPTLEDLIARLSLGLTNIIKTESPDTIIIGGPLAFQFNQFAGLLQSSLSAATGTNIILKKAHRPTESVIFGAYIYSKLNSK